MSREERRLYQRTVGRRAASSPFPAPTQRRPSRGATPAGRPRPGTQPPQAAGFGFTRRFWRWTLAGGAIVGLLLLSVSWDPATRSGTDSLVIGAVGAVAWVLGSVGYRLVRRRLGQRDAA